MWDPHLVIFNLPTWSSCWQRPCSPERPSSALAPSRRCSGEASFATAPLLRRLERSPSAPHTPGLNTRASSPQWRPRQAVMRVMAGSRERPAWPVGGWMRRRWQVPLPRRLYRDAPHPPFRPLCRDHREEPHRGALLVPWCGRATTGRGAADPWRGLGEEPFGIQRLKMTKWGPTR
jgi:hypothetical protein